MGLSYDAQRNEFCAYVLHESETPYGLLLGNFKTYAQSTAKGGVRGLWDADTDQIIFGTHHVAYRLLDRTFFPHQIERELTFLPYAQISEFTLDHRVHVTEAFFVPHGPGFDRAVSFVVDVTLYNPGAAEIEVAVFPWAMLVGQRFYGEPEHEVRAWNDGRFICSKNLETGGERWWGGSRHPVAVELSLREQVLLKSMRRGTLAKEATAQTLADVTPQQAELVSRRIFGAFEYRIAVAAGARESLRLAVVYHKDGTERSRPVLEALLARSARASPHARLFHRTSGRRALPHALAGDQSRGRVGEGQHAANRQGVSARLGRDELAAVGYPRFARYVVARAWLRLFLAGIQPQRARSLQWRRRRERPDDRIRSRRQRLQDRLRSQHQRRHAAAPHRDASPLQRDAGRRLGARAHRSRRQADRLHAHSARRSRIDQLPRQGRRHVRHLVVAQHHSVLHARRCGHGDQRRSGLRLEAAAMLCAVVGRQRPLGAIRRAKRRRCARR